MTDSETLLGALRAAVDDQRPPDPAVRSALAQTADPVVMRKAGRLLAGLNPDGPGLRELRVAILATCTIGSYAPLLRAALVGAGFLPTLEPADYGSFEMTLATGRLAENGDPQLVATLVDASYFLPGDWNGADVEEFDKHVEARLADFRGLVATGVERTSATLVVHTVPLPAHVRDTFLSLRARSRVAQLWQRLNAAILGLAEDHDQVVAVDLAGELADAPVAARDARLHRYGDMPYTDGALLLLAQQVRRVAQAQAGLSRKVLALDLDNTLWGGVVGEVGAEGVQLGGLYPGNCFSELQRSVRRLREQGVILVLASKNDAHVAEAALTEHPEVVLRPEAFSVRAVNWSPKADNLRRAATSLSLSTESFVFMDDSAFERGHVSSELPEVAVVPADGDPAYLVDALLRHGWFDVMALTDTDRKRPELYRTRAMRSDFSAGFGSSVDFLRALNIEVEIASATDFTVGRIAQLAARTNQFNLTGVRFDQATTARMSTAPDHLVVSVSVADRFGDEGIVGAVWVERASHVWRVLNMVLSCRVLGRGVEFATIGWLARRAAQEGIGTLEGRFTPSPKNGVAAGFWTEAGFTPDGGADAIDGGLFTLDVNGAAVASPEWITLRERSER